MLIKNSFNNFILGSNYWQFDMVEMKIFNGKANSFFYFFLLPPP